MNIHQAILAAADHLERNPKALEVMKNPVPETTNPGETGCYLGWIAHFANIRGYRYGSPLDRVSAQIGFNSLPDAFHWLFNEHYGLSHMAFGRQPHKVLRKLAKKFAPPVQTVEEQVTALKKTIAPPSWWPFEWMRRSRSAETA